MRATRATSRQATSATIIVALIAAALTLAPNVSTAQQPSPVQLTAKGAPAPGAAPTLTVTPIVTGLDIPWDLFFTPDGTMIYNERGGGLWARTSNGTVTAVTADFTDL